MGRTLPSITNAFLHEQQSLARFRRALRRTDQRALDDLFGASRHHLAAAAYASHLLPFEIMLLSMMVEEHKLVLRLQIELERLHLLLGLEGTASPEMADEALPTLPSGIPSGREDAMQSAIPSGMRSAIPSGMRSAIAPASLEVHEPSPPPYTQPSEVPERKRKWWAGG